jgi:hypothetical protein
VSVVSVSVSAMAADASRILAQRVRHNNTRDVECVRNNDDPKSRATQSKRTFGRQLVSPPREQSESGRQRRNDCDKRKAKVAAR